MSNNPEKKGVSAIDFFCIGFGAIVGVGWAVAINGWMTSCGGPIPAAIGYIVALVMMIPIALCYCELVPMLPVAGGGMAFSYRAFNENVSFISGWAAFGAFVSIIPWEAIQITDVLGYLIPDIKSGEPLYQIAGTDVYLVTIIIGSVASLLLFALNMRGLAAAATVQKVLCFILVGAAIIGAVAALIGGDAKNWQPIYDVSDPTIYGAASEGLKEVSHHSMFGGIMAILASAPFFLAGFETIPQGVEDAGGDITNVGKTVVLSVCLACVFYAILLFCFGYGWPWQEFAHMANPSASTMFLNLYPGAVGEVLYWLITLGAIAGLFTTWNGFFMASASLLMGMGRGCLVPKVFAKQNKNGIPVPGLIVCLVLSLIGPFLGRRPDSGYYLLLRSRLRAVLDHHLLLSHPPAEERAQPGASLQDSRWNCHGRVLCHCDHRGLRAAVYPQQPCLHGQNSQHHVCGLDGHWHHSLPGFRCAETPDLSGKSVPQLCSATPRMRKALVSSP